MRSTAPGRASAPARLHLPNVEFHTGSWFTPVSQEHFALIACNPPYIADGDPRVEHGVRRYEPRGALFAGADGLDALRHVVAEAPSHLVDGGWLVVEHGDTQGASVRKLFAETGFDTIATHRDLAGLERYTEGRRTR